MCITKKRSRCRKPGTRKQRNEVCNYGVMNRTNLEEQHDVSFSSRVRASPIRACGRSLRGCVCVYVCLVLLTVTATCLSSCTTVVLLLVAADGTRRRHASLRGDDGRGNGWEEGSAVTCFSSCTTAALHRRDGKTSGEAARRRQMGATNGSRGRQRGEETHILYCERGGLSILLQFPLLFVSFHAESMKGARNKGRRCDSVKKIYLKIELVGLVGRSGNICVDLVFKD